MTAPERQSVKTAINWSDPIKSTAADLKQGDAALLDPLYGREVIEAVVVQTIQTYTDQSVQKIVYLYVKSAAWQSRWVVRGAVEPILKWVKI